MFEDGASEQVIDFAGRFLKSTFFERVAHGSVRRGFLLSWAIMGASAAGLALWLYYNPDIHSNTTLSGVCFFAGIGLVGSMVQTDTDLADQQANRYSKWGSGWNLWGDNILFNQFGKLIEMIGIFLCLLGTVYFASQASAERAAAEHAAAMKASQIETYKSHHSKIVHHAQSAAAKHHIGHTKHVNE
jgi:hypothetical protein